MKKRIVSAILILALILSVCCIGTVGAFAAEDSAVVRVGGKSYGAKVGDILEYRISFTYPGKNLSTAQVELPFDFDGLSSYTQDELKTHLSRIAPTTGDASVVQRFDTPGTTGIKGYVMNFVSVNGYSFTTEKRVLSLIFTIEKAGTYDFTSKVRYVEDAAGKTVVDSNYQVKDSSFKYTEAIYQATLDTPKLSASTAAGGIRVKWDPVPGASLYRVYVKSEVHGLSCRIPLRPPTLIQTSAQARAIPTRCAVCRETPNALSAILTTTANPPPTTPLPFSDSLTTRTACPSNGTP